MEVVDRSFDAPMAAPAPVTGVGPPRYLAWDRHRAAAALLSATVVGLLADQVGHTHLVGLAGSLTVVAAAVGLVVSGPICRRGLLWAAVAASVAPWLSVRSSPWLAGPTLIVTVAALVLAASPAKAELNSFAAAWHQGWGVTRAGLDTPLEASRAWTALRGTRPSQPLRRSALGLGLAIPIGLVLTLLLRSGDAYFASLLDGVSLGARLADATVVVVAGLIWLSLVLVGRRHHRMRTPVSPQSFQSLVRVGASAVIGDREVALVLGSVGVVLSGYVVSLAGAALGGAGYVQRQTGLTYAEYARSGFFQLLAVVMVVSLLLIACRSQVVASGRRTALVVLSLFIAGLTLVMVAVCIARLQTYRAVFGLTMLRWSTTVFALWLGIVVVLVAGSLVLARMNRALVPAVVLSACAMLIAVNAVNPEARVAQENIDRIDWSSGATVSPGGVGLDSHYLGHRLSADVVPTVLDRLRLLPAEEQRYLLDALCAARPAPDGWSWNHSRAAAARRLNQACPTNRPFTSIAGARSVVNRSSHQVW